MKEWDGLNIDYYCVAMAKDWTEHHVYASKRYGTLHRIQLDNAELGGQEFGLMVSQGAIIQEAEENLKEMNQSAHDKKRASVRDALVQQIGESILHWLIVGLN